MKWFPLGISYALFALSIILVDQLTKYGALTYVPQELVVTDFFSLIVMINKGVSWSLFQGDSVLHSIFVSAIIMVVLFFLTQHMVLRLREGVSIWSEVAVMAGAISNLIDRAMHGGVIDFLSFGLFPVFNIADCAIVLGVFAMLYSSLFLERRSV